MDFDGIERRHGARLPHWRRGGATYFVTFRLADSLPESVVVAYREELRLALEEKRRAVSRSLRPTEVGSIKRRILRTVEDLLDNGTGSCVLADPQYADIVETTLRFFDQERYDLFAWCVMPNHVHVLLKPLGEAELSEILHSWKSFTGHKLPSVRKNQTWEPESFDHLVRSEEHLWRFACYTVENPTKARLNKWRWVWSRPEFQVERL